MNPKRERQSGFTMVELLVVLAVITAIMAALLLLLIGNIDRASKSFCIAEGRQVRVYYLANAAYMEYDVPDEELPVLLSAAAADARITETEGLTYTASCGGTCTVEFSRDNIRVVRIVCSVHGEIFAEGESYSVDERATALQAAMETLLRTENLETYGVRRVDGAYPDALRDRILSIVTPEDRRALEQCTWAVAAAGEDFANYRIYMGEGSIQEARPGTRTPVAVFDCTAKELGERRVLIRTRTDAETGQVYRILRTN